MTLTDAQDTAVQALTQATAHVYPKVYVHPYDGVFTVAEGRKAWHATPALLVSPLSCDDQGVKLAVYTLCKATDRDQVKVLDLATEALRRMAGKGRTQLSVASRSLYDKDALAGGLRLWVHLVDWPHLAVGDTAESESGPVWREKLRLKELITAAYTDLAVATTQAEADAALTGASLPFITILAGAGTFERGERRSVKYTQEGKLYEREVKGVARWPISVKAYARSEQEAESLLWPLLPRLSRLDTVDGLNIHTTVASIEDGGEEAGANVAGVTLNLEAPAATPPRQVPTFRESAVSGG